VNIEGILGDIDADEGAAHEQGPWRGVRTVP
jgi:hypothetical protein